jgi:hypothetical protein
MSVSRSQPEPEEKTLGFAKNWSPAVQFLDTDFANRAIKALVAVIINIIKIVEFTKEEYHLDVLFVIQICVGYKIFPLLDTVGLRVPARYIRDFSLFNVYSYSKRRSSARGT